LPVHGGRSGGEALAHGGIREDVLEVAGKLIVSPMIAMHFEALAGFMDAGGVVVAVPDVGHDYGGLSEIEAFGKGVVAAMMDDGVNLGDDGRLREPLIKDEIFRDVRIGVEVAADIDEGTNGELAERIDEALKSFCVTAAERTEADVDERLAGVFFEGGDGVGLLGADAALKVLEFLRIERAAAAEFHGFGIEKEIEIRRGFEKLAEGIRRFVAGGEEGVEAGVNGGNDIIEVALVASETVEIVLAAAGEVGRDLRIGDFVFRARDDADPRLGGLLDGGKEDDVVDTNEVGADFVENSR